MRRHLLLCAALLLASSGLVASLACDFNDTDSLTRCVEGILADGRPALRQLLDPLPLVDINGTYRNISWAATGARVHGLGDYRVQQLEIVHSAPLLITVRFGALWRRLLATAAGWFRVCGQVFGSRRCVSFTARPRILVFDFKASVVVYLHLAHRDGRLKVTPTGTQIDISVPDIRVTVNLDGFLGVLDKLLQKPSDKYANRLTQEFWVSHKKTVEDMAKKHLNMLVEQHLSPKLETLLKGIAP